MKKSQKMRCVLLYSKIITNQVSCKLTLLCTELLPATVNCFTCFGKQQGNRGISFFNRERMLKKI